MREYNKTSRSPSNFSLIAHLPLSKKKKKEETAFLDLTDPQKDPCILSLSLFSKLLIFVAFNIAIFNKNKGKPKSNEVKQ